MRKRPTRDSILLPVVLVILLLLLIVATRPVLAQSLPSQPPSPATPIEVGLRGTWDGELTADDGGRDWHSFDSTADVNYIIELKNTMVFSEVSADGSGGDPHFVPGHLVDPSILEVVDEHGVQVLGEHDQGGFTANFARAFFTPEEGRTSLQSGPARRTVRPMASTPFRCAATIKRTTTARTWASCSVPVSTSLQG